MRVGGEKAVRTPVLPMATPAIVHSHLIKRNIQLHLRSQSAREMAERSSHTQQSPATPLYILRGHTAPIHALDIFSQNLRLVSGDADGWIVIWDLVTKRPVVVWKAHEGAVLEVKGFQAGVGVTEIYT